MQRLAAMVTTTNTNTGEIKHRGDVIGMNTLHHKRGQGSSIRLLLWRGTKNAQAIDRLKPAKQMGGELRLPGLNRIESKGLQISNCSTHADRFTNSWCARFKLMREFRPGAVIQEHLLNHLATTKEGWHRHQGLLRCP